MAIRLVSEKKFCYVTRNSSIFDQAGSMRKLTYCAILEASVLSNVS